MKTEKRIISYVDFAKVMKGQTMFDIINENTITAILNANPGIGPTEVQYILETYKVQLNIKNNQITDIFFV